MTVMLRGIGRLFVVLAGYAVASVAASAAMMILLTAALALPADGSGGVLHGPLIFAVPIVSIFVGYFAFVPSALLLALSEILGRRDWLFYALGGAAVSVAVIGYIWRETGIPYIPQDGPDFLAVEQDLLPLVAEPGVAATLIAAGICGGIAYWLVAGRTAGSWRQPRRDVTSPAP